MNEKAHALGIPESDLIRALTLVRNLRIQAIGEQLDPRATRIALIYAKMVDTHFAVRRLTHKTLAILDEIAREFYKDQVRRE